MTHVKPTVALSVAAAMIDSAPDRVRRRLDREPTTAASWEWTANDDGWQVQAGGETVALPLGTIGSIEQIRCSCLLSPRCFHVLACLSILEIAVESTSTDETTETNRETIVEQPRSDQINSVLLGEDQRRAVQTIEQNIAQVLRVGVANSGVVLQSGLLRSVHQCRAVGLPRLATIGLRILSGIRDLRARAATADPAQLADDTASLLETVRRLRSTNPAPFAWVGSSRRPQFPVQPRKLHGVFAEPLLTRSGHAGAVVYLLGEDDRFYTVSSVRPGDEQLARDAYRGGIEIGSLTAPGRQLARKIYLGSELTSSPDGRLGKGQQVRVAEHGDADWSYAALQNRFQKPLALQWSDVFANANLPEEFRPAGWDFLFFVGRVIGAAGPELLVQVDELERPLRLGIAQEGKTFPFRENLRMLSHASGLQLQWIVRCDPFRPQVVLPLAVAPMQSTAASHDESIPQLECPAEIAGHFSLGFDEIQSRHLRRAHPAPVIVAATSDDAFDDPLHALHRRWVASLVSGFSLQSFHDSAREEAEIAAFTRRGYSTAASLIDRYRNDARRDPSWAIDTFLATAVYLRYCRFELARCAS